MKKVKATTCSLEPEPVEIRCKPVKSQENEESIPLDKKKQAKRPKTIKEMLENMKKKKEKARRMQ